MLAFVRVGCALEFARWGKWGWLRRGRRRPGPPGRGACRPRAEATGRFMSIDPPDLVAHRHRLLLLAQNCLTIDNSNPCRRRIARTSHCACGAESFRRPAGFAACEGSGFGGWPCHRAVGLVAPGGLWPAPQGRPRRPKHAVKGRWRDGVQQTCFAVVTESS